MGGHLHGVITDDLPFVLLDDARPGGIARLYRAPSRIVLAEAAPDLAGVLAAIGDAGGRHAAGFLSYEAGAAFEPRLAPLSREAPGLPLAWFGLFESCETITDVAAWLPDSAGAWVSAPEPGIDKTDYDAAFDRVEAWIAAGDLYQANLTFRAQVRTAGHPLALYAAIRRRAAAGWGGLVWTGDDWLLSFSPELFFRIDAGTITARPMKGTVRRGATLAEDAALSETLVTDAKQRAENLMIVDLMRNDLTRIAAPGSVAVPELFRVESYPSIHQMTSTVTATLAQGLGAADVLTAIFPCGSVTGAPKIRAMEAIHAVEPPRGVYTGSIGAIAPNGDADFNVAIRTLHLKPGADSAMLGLGSGIVADSRSADEWDECRAKGDFLTLGQHTPDLIETMAFDPERGVLRLDRHLARLKSSARAFCIPFDRHHAGNELQAATFRLRSARKVRLLVSASGAIAIETGRLPTAPTGAVVVRIVPLPVDPRDFRLRHKTADRGFYDGARHAAGCAEVVFARVDGRLTEGSFTNLFVERGGVLVTPPLALGLLPGILRAELLESGRAIEGDLVATDLSFPFFVGNALRGLLRAVAVAE